MPLSLAASAMVNGVMANIDGRTGLEVISEAECWELAASKEVGRLAISIANDPDVFPLNYRVDPGPSNTENVSGYQHGPSIVIRTNAGLKLAGAILGNAVAFEIDDLQEDAHEGWSVVIHGRGEEIENVEDWLHAEDLNVSPWANNPKSRYVRITPDRVSGRRISGG